MFAFSLHWGWHRPSPHAQLPQSDGQFADDSPQPTWQSWLPQMHGCPQSWGHVCDDSPH